MKKQYLLIAFVLLSTLSFSQKKEKIKGSKTVTTEQKEIGAFDALEVDDNIEVFLEKGDKNELRIEADDNLHDIIGIDLRDKTVRLYTSKEVTNFKKLIVKVTYTNDFKLLTSKNESIVNAASEIQLDDITFRALDYSKMYLNINAKNFKLENDNKSKTELNLKAEKATVQLSNNASLKALITSIDLKCDLYQKASATIEGDVINGLIRLDNNTDLVANKLTLKNADVITEDYTILKVFASTTIAITASEKSEIQLFGNPKIEIKKFADESKLFKKAK
jgi:Putative auto-transporter adhesin, head GIN domain